MSTRTKSMTHFYQAGDCLVGMVGNAGGLAKYLFEGVQTLAGEHGLDNLLSGYDKAMIDLEAYVKEKVTDKETLSEVWPSWKARKSALRGAINNGLDPTKYESYRKYTDASQAVNKKKKEGALGGAPGTSSGKGDGSPDTPRDPVASTPTAGPASTMPTAVRDKLNEALSILSKLDEATAIKVLGDMSSAAHYQLRKTGGRMSNLTQG